jgi:hypothetical protein
VLQTPACGTGEANKKGQKGSADRLFSKCGHQPQNLRKNLRDLDSGFPSIPYARIFSMNLVASVRTKYLAFRCPPEHSFPTLNKKIKTCWVPIPKKTGSDWNTPKLLDQDLDITTADSIIESAW